MKMEWIIAAVIGGLILVGDFFAGYKACENTKPTTNIINTYQTTHVRTQTESIQQSLQVQSTVLVPGVTNIVISIKDYTNLVKLTNFIISNYSAKTN